MASPNQSMFRPEALEYRLRTQGQRQTEVTFPRWMARRVGITLWIVLGLLAISGAAACFAEVPVTASGLAIVMGEASDTSDGVTVAVLMPEADGQNLDAGVEARLFFGAGDAAIDGTLLSVSPEPRDIFQVERQLGLPASSLAMLDGSFWLVDVRVDPAFATMLMPGATGRAELPGGSQYAGTFLPLVGRLFRSDS